MKKLLLVVIVSSTIIISCKQKNIASDSKTEIKISADTIFITNKPANDSTIVDFTVANIGKAPLKIMNANASCGCSQIKYDTSLIMPSQQTKVILVYHHKEFRADEIKNIVFQTNTNPQFNVVYIKEIKKETKN